MASTMEPVSMLQRELVGRPPLPHAHCSETIDSRKEYRPPVCVAIVVAFGVRSRSQPCLPPASATGFDGQVNA